MKMTYKIVIAALVAMVLTGCGTPVEVPPAHVGKIMGQHGYQDNLIPTSKTRLAACFNYCDKLVLLDISDRPAVENMSIFIPEDKLKLGVSVQTTLSVNPAKTESLFGTLPLTPTNNNSISMIAWDTIYKTYAKQIVLTETREYLSQFSISQIASSMEKVNSDLRTRIQKAIKERTPFDVRYVGITNIEYPSIITDAQENAAKRREQIQQEEAQLEISKVQLQRELEESRLRRQIEKEKAQTEAEAQKIQREVVDSRVMKLRELENQRLWIEKWDGKLPVTQMGGDSQALMMVGGAK